MRMRSCFKTLIFLLGVTLLVSCAKTSDVKFYDNKGHSYSASELRGKWVVVNYWASWCPSCRMEMPELNNFYKNNKDANVVLIGVDAETPDADAIDDNIKKADVQFPILRQDPGAEWNLPIIEVIPTTFIIDPRGKVVKNIKGVNSENSLRHELQQLKNEA